MANQPRALHTSHKGRAKRKMFKVRRTSIKGRGSIVHISHSRPRYVTVLYSPA
jgi:hypothetical protein